MKALLNSVQYQIQRSLYLLRKDLPNSQIQVVLQRPDQVWHLLGLREDITNYFELVNNQVGNRFV